MLPVGGFGVPGRARLNWGKLAIVVKVVHAYNLHRGGGGADDATLATIRTQRESGFEVHEFVRHSASLPAGLRGKIDAMLGGIYARKALAEFAAFLDRIEPDIVHIHEVYPLLSPWILATSARRGYPVVLSCYDYRITCPVTTNHIGGDVCTRCVGGREYWAALKNCRDNRLESIAFALRSRAASFFQLYQRYVTRFVTPTRFAAGWLSTHGSVAPSRIDTVPCRIDLPPEPADPATGQYVGFAGRMVPEKGFDTLFEAINRVGVPCVVALPAGSDCFGIPESDWLSVITTRNREELNRFYSRARMHVMPSEWFETFGIVAAESMSYGVPVVASRIGALAETVEDGRTGLLFDPGNSADLAEKIERIWLDNQLVTQLGKGARDKVAKCYDAQSHANHLHAVYLRAIEDERRTRLCNTGGVDSS